MEVQLTILDVGTRWCGQFHVPTTLTPPPPRRDKGHRAEDTNTCGYTETPFTFPWRSTQIH